jgi:hypothetical protein
MAEADMRPHYFHGDDFEPDKEEPSLMVPLMMAALSGMPVGAALVIVWQEAVLFFN